MSRQKRFFQLLSLLLAIVQVQAQSSGESSLRVRVLDPRGAVIVGARVRLRMEGRKEQTAETNKQGESLFSRLPVGQCAIRVEAAGFQLNELSDIQLKTGANQLDVQLEIAPVVEEVGVTRDEREEKTDPRGTAFSRILTQEEIDQLPDDPDELEAALRAMAGPGGTIRVNGFRGGRLPPKSQIREIRIRTNAFSADSHDAEMFGIDIFTKPGMDLWRTSFNFGFRDESLNARNAFARTRGPEQNRRFGVTLDGPLWRNHTSLFLAADGFSSYDSKTIVAALPDGPFSDVFRRPSRALNLSSRLEHALTKSHTFRAEYQRNATRTDNLGVGDYDLPERAFTSDQAEHVFRLADTGTLSKWLVNEVRFQARWQEIAQSSTSQSPAILVLNAFNRGGAQVAGGRRIREIEVADNLDFVIAKKHSMRAGMLLEGGHYRSDEFRNSGGTFIFSSLDDFRAGRPTTYSRRVGDPRVEFSQYEFAWYVLDDIRVNRSLALSFGLRHELQGNLTDRNNLAPRAAMSWSPDGKVTIRLGAGIFYDWFSSQLFEQTLRVDGQRQRDIVVNRPGFPDPLSGGTPITLPPSRIQRDPTMRMPYFEQASVGAERAVTKWGQLRATYMYQRGVHLLRGHNINAPLAGAGRPDPTVGNITQIESTANSTTHLLNIGMNFQNPQRRIFGGINYVLARSINDADGPLSLPADNFNLRAERGPAMTDIRHRLFGMFNAPLLKGFRISSVFNILSAMPYNITTGFDDNGDSVTNDRPAGVSRNSARGAAQVNLSARLGWSIGFGQPREGGAQGANMRVVRIRNENDALGAAPMLGGNNKRYRFEIYIQASNLLNHTNRMMFSGVQTSPFFGHATAAQPPRRIETGMRFNF
jgi:hypothetical protein